MGVFLYQPSHLLLSSNTISDCKVLVRELVFLLRPRMHNRASRHKLNYVAHFSFSSILYLIYIRLSFDELLTHDTPTQRNLFHALLRNYESKQTGLALKSAEHTSPNLAFVKTCGEFSIGLLRNSFIFSTPLIEKESGGDDEKYGEHIHTPEKEELEIGSPKKNQLEKNGR